MTEDEAKTKWCPFGQALPTQAGRAQPGLAAYNRCGGALDDADPHCLASACMAWRWRGGRSKVTGYEYAAAAPTEGFCGLAGRPL